MAESTTTSDFWFPGRWIGGTSMIIGPLLLLAAQLLILPFDFFFPQQLIAYHEHPTRIATAYNLFLAGNILLWPAVLTLARYIGQKKPVLGLWAGTLVMLGLFARTFHYGINHLAFQLVEVQDIEMATTAVADSYGAFHIVSGLSAAIILGWILLAFGAYRSGVLGLIHSICLGLMSALMIGVLKGASLMSVICTAGLCVAFIPLGIKVLTHGPKPDNRHIILWSLAILGTAALMYFFGQAG